MLKGFLGWAVPMTDTVSSKMDLLLHKSEPISQPGGASVKTCLRKHKNYSTIQTQSWKWSEKNVRQTALQITRSEKEGKEVAQVVEQRFPYSPWRRHWWEACHPQPMEVKGEEDIFSASYGGLQPETRN